MNVIAIRDASAVPGLRRSPWTRLCDGLSACLGSLWRPLLYVGVIFGFLMGRALPGSLIAPLGLAYYAAVRGAGFGPLQALPIAVAVVVGSLSAPTSSTLWVAGGLLFCHLVSSLFRLTQRGASPTGAAVVASTTVALLALVQPIASTPIELVFRSGLTGAFALIFTLGIADVTAGRLFYRGGSDAPVSAIVILATALCGLEGLVLWGGPPLHDVAASFVVLVAAYVGGPMLGATAAAVLGISFLFTELSGVTQTGLVDPANLASGMALVIAGLLAGTFRDLRRPGVGIAFCLGMMTYSMIFLDGLAAIVQAFWGVGAATAMFWLLPRQWLARVPTALTYEPKPPKDSLRNTADWPLVLNRIRGMSRVLKEVSRAFDQVAVVQATPDHGVGRVFEQVTDRVCRSCSLYGQCWEREFPKTYQIYTNLWTQIDGEGPLTTQPLPAELEEHCIYPDRVASTLNYLHDLHHSQNHWERRLAEGRGVVGEYVRNVGRLLDHLTEEAGDGPVRLTNTPVLRAVCGVARLPKRGGIISGDSFVADPLGPDRYLMALSDGMGVGREAALESRHCVRLLHEILRAGFSTEAAVKTVNSALLLHSPEESFATVDISLLDLTTGRAEFVKVGAAPSFLKRGTDVTVIKLPSIPVGIINQVQVEPEFRLLRPGDMIIMITDGIWDVSKDDLDKERWLLSHLGRERSLDPEEVAESLLARALELMPSVCDDMTVLVARVDALTAKGIEERPFSSQTAEWAPVRLAVRTNTGAKGSPPESKSSGSSD